MARSKVTALGVDLFGVERAVLSIRSDRSGVSVVAGALENVTPSDLVGGVAPSADALGHIITPKTPGISDATVGVNEMTGKAEFALANVSSVDRVVGERRKYAAAIKGLPGRQGKVDAPVVVVIPIPNRRDRKWDAFSAAVRPQIAVAAVDALQQAAPAIRPRLDLRSAAALRAFFASDVAVASDYAAFVHVDALDLTTVLLSRGEVSFIQRASGGLLALARTLAASSDRTLDATWAELAAHGLSSFGDRGREELLSLVDMEVRNLDGRLKTMWEASAKADDHADPPRIESVYLSGVLADDACAAELELGGGISVYPFRPVAQLPGASAEIVRFAGRYTVAYGHALNSIALAPSTPDRNALATDITPLIDLSLLPASLRDESAMPEISEPATSNHRAGKGAKPKRQLSPAMQRRIAASMYIGGLGLLGATAYPSWQRSQIRKNTAALQREAQAMSASVFQDSTKLEQFRASFRKARSLASLREMALLPHEQLAGLARATSMSNGNVWLTQLRTDAPGSMTIDGRSGSLGSFASYFRALKTDPAFLSVTYAITSPAQASPPGSSAPVAPTDTAGTFPFTITLALRTPVGGSGAVSPLESILQGTVPQRGIPSPLNAGSVVSITPPVPVPPSQRVTPPGE